MRECRGARDPRGDACRPVHVPWRGAPRAPGRTLTRRRQLDAGKKPQLVPGSCAAWMLGHDRAGVVEAPWGETLGDRLVGTHRMVGGHFSMVAQMHAAESTQEMRAAVAVLETRTGG